MNIQKTRHPPNRSAIPPQLPGLAAHRLRARLPGYILRPVTPIPGATAQCRLQP